MVARHDGSWTHMDKALKRAKSLLEDWMKTHQNRDCFPPTIINITDGEYNGTTDDNMMQLSNELKSMFTNDGNVLFFNIHIVPEQEEVISFPSEVHELNGDHYGEKLFAMSSLLPLSYNDQMKQILNEDIDADIRHRAMAVNTGMQFLAKFMKIGTLSSMLVNNI